MGQDGTRLTASRKAHGQDLDHAHLAAVYYYCGYGTHILPTDDHGLKFTKWQWRA